MTAPRPRPSILIVIPCLNEAGYIRGLLDALQPSARRLNAKIVVVDGGSMDASPEIVTRYAEQNQNVILLPNPMKIQSAAINLAVRQLGQDFDYFIRIDAHGKYPEDFCDRLVDEAIVTGSDSVVVSMITEGSGVIQSAAAAAQNSKLGTGGASHRHVDRGHWIDHGHHALMRVAAFLAVGGYDESFRANEDSELDIRLGKAGYMIWLTNKTVMTYFPRPSLGKLYVQYLAYGRGRARNILKHRLLPKVRQMIPLSVFPCVVAGFGALVHMSVFGAQIANMTLLLPVVLWLAACAAFGLQQAIRNGSLLMAFASVSAATMHFAWSFGFWMQLMTGSARKSAP